jgi:hypothetical protein
MDRDMQTRIGADRQRRMRLRDFVERGPAIEIFVTIPLAAGNPPRGAGIGDRKLGQLLADVDVVELRLIRKLVAKADAIVERTEHDGERATGRVLLHQLDAQLVVAIAYVAPLAPGLLPGLVEAARLDAIAAEVALQLRRVGQQESEPRLGDDLTATARDRIPRPTFIVDRHADGQNIAGRADRAECLRTRYAHSQRQEQQNLAKAQRTPSAPRFEREKHQFFFATLAFLASWREPLTATQQPSR